MNSASWRDPHQSVRYCLNAAVLPYFRCGASVKFKDFAEYQLVKLSFIRKINEILANASCPEPVKFDPPKATSE